MARVPDNEPSATSTPETSGALEPALRRLLRPLVRLLIARGIGLPHLTNLLKSVYVEVADDHFRLEAGRITDSRISVLTGVHRKDVKRLRNDIEPPRRGSTGARIIGLWTGSPPYLDRQGGPRPLSREEFEGLVSSVCNDVHPRTFLDEWEQRGFVARNADGGLQLRCDAFVPSKDEEELAFYFGRNLHDHIAAAADNILGRTPPHLERAVFYGGLRPDSVADLKAAARTEAVEAIQRINRLSLEHLERDRDHPDAVARFCFGAYIYDATTEPDGKKPR